MSETNQSRYSEENGYMLITPEIATQFLLVNNKNRKLRDQFVDELVRKIQAGQWQPNTLDSIGFFEDGSLANGQHRLTAIARAGVPVYAKVEHGIPMDAAICIDSGKSRTASDNIRIVTRETFYTRKLTKVVSTAGVNGRKYTHEDHLKIALRYKEELVFLQDMFKGYPKYLATTAIQASVLTAMFAGVDSDKLRRFVEVLGSGRANSDMETYIVEFKNRLISDYYEETGKKRRDYVYEMKRCQNVIYNFVHKNAPNRFVSPTKYRYPLIEFDLSDIK